MALTDELKLKYCKNKLVGKIESIGTWADLVSLVQNVTPVIIKNYIVSGLSEEAAVDRASSINRALLADDKESLETEVTNL